MKKIIALISVFLIMFSLFTACTSKKDDTDNNGQVSSDQGDSISDTTPTSPSNTGGSNTNNPGSSETVGKSSTSDIIHQLPASPDVVPAP